MWKFINSKDYRETIPLNSLNYLNYHYKRLHVRVRSILSER